MSNRLIKKVLKKRILGGFGDMLAYVILSSISFTICMELFNIETKWFAPYFLIFYFIYYAAIPKITNGYTLIGFILGMRIIKLDGSRISVWEYLIRSLYGIASYVYFLGFARVKTNTLAQFYFDKPFLTTVVLRGTKLPLSAESVKDFSFYFLAE